MLSLMLGITRKIELGMAKWVDTLSGCNERGIRGISFKMIHTHKCKELVLGKDTQPYSS